MPYLTSARGNSLARVVFAVAVPGCGPAIEAQVLEEIVVTAQRREQNIQDVPIAMTAVTSRSIEDKGLTSLAQVADYVPNVQMDSTSPFSGSSGVLSPYIRGIGQNDFAFNLEPGVGVYIDGVYLARTIGANVDLLDVDRVEVLRGPQGTLFGRNTIGGALNIITSRWSVVVGGRNLTDERYIMSGFRNDGVISANYSRPTEWYVTLRLSH